MELTMGGHAVTDHRGDDADQDRGDHEDVLPASDDESPEGADDGADEERPRPAYQVGADRGCVDRGPAVPSRYWRRAPSRAWTAVARRQH